MNSCFLVFSEPGTGFHGVHRTIDGATHNAAALDATTMPDGRPITVVDVREVLDHQAVVMLTCAPHTEFQRIRIERHAIFV